MKKNFIYKCSLISISIWMVLFLSGCSKADQKVVPSVFAPVSFKEEDIVGTWEINAGPFLSEEFIIFSADHQFEQIFTYGDPKLQFKNLGSWEIVKSNEGCTYVLLYGMKYYYQELERANNGNRLSSGIEKGRLILYWDECSQDVITMPDMVVLSVMQFPDEPRNIILEHMSTTRDSTEMWFTLVADN